MSIKIMKVIKGITLYAMFCFNTVTIADTVFYQGGDRVIVKYDRQISLALSSKGINHLHFADERIEKIIGDSSEYGALVSGNGSDLFLTSKKAAGKHINMSIELSSGFIVDVVINIIKSKHPKIIYLKHELSDASNLDIFEAEQMMQSMRVGKKGKYYVKSLKHYIKLVCKDSLQVKQYASYRYGDYRGAAFELSNLSKTNSITTYSRELAYDFKNVLLSKVENPLLEPGQKTRGFIVWEEKDDK